MEQLLVLNNQKELTNKEFGKFINSDSNNNEKVLSSDLPSSEWELGNNINKIVFV